MKNLILENINSKAPYQVMQMEGYPHLFYFHTDFEVDYEISIKPNDAFVRDGAYTLDIHNIWNQVSPGDAKLRLTIMAIIEEFFNRLSNRQFDEAFALMVPAVRDATEIRSHFGSFRMDPFLDGIQ
jgi:hypothetical protein